MSSSTSESASACSSVCNGEVVSPATVRFTWVIRAGDRAVPKTRLRRSRFLAGCSQLQAGVDAFRRQVFSEQRVQFGTRRFNSSCQGRTTLLLRSGPKPIKSGCS